MNKILHFIILKYFKIIPMNKLLKLFKTIYCKYKNLKKEYWTHILVGFTYMFTITTIGIFFQCIINKHSQNIFILYLLFALITYSFLLILIILFIFISKFSNIKITDKFLLKNKIYNIIWNIGNIISIIIINFILYIVFRDSILPYIH